MEIPVSEGATATSVAGKLKEKNLVSSPYPFLLWIRGRGAAHKIHVGLYRIPRGRSSFWIADDLINGRTQKMKLVIPEGFASWQIAERLGELRICDPEKFKQIVAQKNLEGFLFPATYEMDIGITADSVANLLINKFESQWTPEMETRAASIGFSKRETVTLASIVEREVRVREELPLVSAVYHNRLRKKMKLDADPTVQFALGYWKSRLTYNDYRNVKSPYNTYLVAGLPPGPICNPGLDAIQAVLWPAQSDALYFVAQEGGRHSFSATYREHTNKVNRRNRTNRK